MSTAYGSGRVPNLSADQLAAFAAVERTGSFTKASALLHLSQPALSRRVAALEEQLETVLLTRGPGGATLTESGRRLLAFVDAQRGLEEELLGDLAPGPTSYRGAVRIAGLSSLVPHVVLRALASFLRAHPAVQVEIHRDVDRRVVESVAAGRVDFGISQGASGSPGLVDVELGHEEFVMVESRVHRTRRAVFLDVSPGDETTESFLAAQVARLRPAARLTRSFLHDEAGILLGVQLGLGRAVKPRHTLPRGAAVRIDRRFAAMSKPVFLHYRRQRYYGRLHEAIRALIEVSVRRHLA